MIHADKVTPTDIRKILRLYEEICGGTTTLINPKAISNAIKARQSIDGQRIGSYWDEHSKLYFDLERGTNRVIAFMYENFDPKARRDDNPHYREALAAAEQFRKAVLGL